MQHIDIDSIVSIRGSDDIAIATKENFRTAFTFLRDVYNVKLPTKAMKVHLHSDTTGKRTFYFDLIDFLCLLVDRFLQACETDRFSDFWFLDESFERSFRQE